MEEVAPGHVAVGRVLSPHGVRGEVKVQPLAGLPAGERGVPQLLAPKRTVNVAGSLRTIQSVRGQGRFLYLKLSGIDDRTAALALRDRYLQVPESDLQPLGEGEYYRFQLVGLTVRTTQGEPLGRIVSVLSTPSNDVFVVQGPQGEVLVPATDDIVTTIDIPARTMTIEAVPGLLPDAGRARPRRRHERVARRRSP